MKRFVAPSIGIAGRIVAVLLIAVLLEFGVSTVLYERASRFAVREDEAHRLAEHLVISRKLVADEDPAGRAEEAAELSTDRYALRWQAALPPPPIAPTLDSMRDQIIAWEPALAKSDLRLQLVSPGRDPYVVGGLRLPDDSWLYFRTIEPLVTVNLAVERILLTLIPAIALIVLGILLVRRMLFPLRRLAAAADGFGASGGGGAVPETGPGDVRRVTAAFNRMQHRITRLIADQAQALAAVGHDMRTPLARLKLRAEAISDAALRRSVEGDVAEMEAMIASLLAFLGGDDDPERPVRIDLAVMCETIVDHLVDSGQAAHYDGPAHLDATVRQMALKRAVNNLADNAARYGDTVWLRLSQTDAGIIITVEDDGPGIPEADLARVIEPFVRLEDARTRDTVGFGLGLAIVARTVDTLGGTLMLGNRPEGGLCAAITLPVA